MPKRNIIPKSELYCMINEIKHKKCNRCFDFKPADRENFYFNKSNKTDGLYPYCIACAIKKGMDYEETHKEQKLANARKHSHKPWVKEKYRRFQKEYRERGGQNKWYDNNKDKLKQYREKRKLEKKHEVSYTEWALCKEYFDNECAYCGLRAEEHFVKRKGKMVLYDLSKEHVAHDGSNDLSNCVPSCISCNSKKWTFIFEEWYNENNETFLKDRFIKINKWLTEDYLKFIQNETL